MSDRCGAPPLPRLYVLRSANRVTIRMDAASPTTAAMAYIHCSLNQPEGYTLIAATWARKSKRGGLRQRLALTLEHTDEQTERMNDAEIRRVFASEARIAMSPVKDRAMTAFLDVYTRILDRDTSGEGLVGLPTLGQLASVDTPDPSEP